jgi:hypothetical protein
MPRNETPNATPNQPGLVVTADPGTITLHFTHAEHGPDIDLTPYAQMLLNAPATQAPQTGEIVGELQIAGTVIVTQGGKKCTMVEVTNRLAAGLSAVLGSAPLRAAKEPL